MIIQKEIKLYKYIDGVNDTPFPNEEEQVISTEFSYDAKRMGGAPTLSASVYHDLCLDKLWTYNVYATFNEEKYFIKQIPSSQYTNDRAQYKHDIELVSERVVLDNVYFYDVVSADSNFDRPVSNSSQFAFFGDIREFVSRVNESLKYCNVNYTLVVDKGISSESKLVSFENKVISEVLQEIYNTYEIPYYFTGHIIHVGFTDNAITETFKYGVDNSLLSIQKTNANYKIVTRVTGTGSNDNIPYYYPNSTEQGELSIRLNGQEGYVNIINQSKFSKVKAGSIFHYVEVDSLTADLSIGWRNISVVKLEPAEEGEAVKWEINARYYFSVAQTGDVTIKLGCNIDDSPSPITGVLMREGVEKPLYNFTENTYRINLTPATYYVNIKVEVIDHGNIIENYDNDDLMEYVFDVTSTQFFANYQGWVLNDPSSSNIVSLYDYGLEISGATVSKGSRLEIIKTGWVQPQDYLMPPIYRQSGGMERFYNAINNKYPLVDGGYYEFTNEYIEGKQKEHIVSFENIKPTIKGITNSLGYPIDVFVDFAYDLNDSDDIDEEGNYIHPYFFAKLRKFDGEYGFNLFEHAIQGNEMTISMTSGPCGACEFTIMVDNDTMQNTVQVDKDGNLYRDEEGNVLFGSPQEQQNDTRTHSVWIALKKDINTFGVVMPNATHNYKPRRGDDTFVILHIELPQAYITAAEYRLMQELIKYMKLNNDEKFNFSIAFSRIFFAENPDVLALLNENSRLQIEYNKERYELYVSSFSYKMKSNEPLPEITVELSDTLTISQNALQTSIDKIKQDIMQSVGSIDWLKLGLAYFLRKDQKDRTRHRLASDEGFEIGNFVSGVSGAFMFIDKQTLKSVLEIDKLYVRVKAYFEQLEIVNVNSIGGKQIISPAGGIHITKVEDGENAVDEAGNEYYNEWPYFRCYFTAEQDGESVGNRWHIGDLAYCKAFNLNTTSTGSGSRYYWRKVVNIGVDYIDLSRTDCDVDSDIPVAGDVVCQRGNADDVDRQNFIEFSSVDAFSPNITLFQGVNDYSIVDKEIVSFGVDKTSNKAFMNVYGDMYVGNRDQSSFIRYTPERGVEINGTLRVGTKLGDDDLETLIKNAHKEDYDLLKEFIDKMFGDIQDQIDGVIETWFYDPDPTLTNAPAVDWTTDELKNNHLGDLYYSGKGRAYRFQLNSDTGEYYWNEIVDTDIIRALENAKKAQDTADGKRRIFTQQPTINDAYDVGDLWVNVTYGDLYKNDILRAKQSKAVGEPFDIAHWQLASKYTDDTVANEALEAAKKAQGSADELQKTVSSMRDFTDEAFRDGIIDQTEFQSFETYFNQINSVIAQVQSSYTEVYNNSMIDSTVAKTNLKLGYDAFISAANALKSSVEAAIADKKTTTEEKADVDLKYSTFNTKYGDYTTYLNQAIKYIQDLINSKIDSTITDLGTYAYLKEALQERETQFAGGLIQSTTLALGQTTAEGFQIMAGTNGKVGDRGGKTIASWFGGGMNDLFDYYDSETEEFNVPAGVRCATGLDRMDGTGYRANGKFWWDNDGNIHADPLSFFVGEDKVGALLASFQVVLKADGKHADYLIPKVPFQTLNVSSYIDIGNARLQYDYTNKALYVTHKDGVTDTIGFYSEGYVSAKGANPSSSGGGSGSGGASALYQLIDVLANSTGDAVQGATNGSVLMYNGTKWYAGTVESGITSVEPLTLQVNGSTLATFDGTSATTVSLTIPTKLSQLTNDIFDDSYLPLTGGTLTGPLYTTSSLYFNYPNGNNQMQFHQNTYSSGRNYFLQALVQKSGTTATADMSIRNYTGGGLEIVRIETASDSSSYYNFLWLGVDGISVGRQITNTRALNVPNTFEVSGLNFVIGSAESSWTSIQGAYFAWDKTNSRLTLNKAYYSSGYAYADINFNVQGTISSSSTLTAPQFSAQSGGVYANYRLYLPESASTTGATERPRLGRFDRAAGSAVLQLGTSNIFDIVDASWTTTLLRVSSSEITYKGTAISLNGHTHSYLPLSGGTLTGQLTVSNINGYTPITSGNYNSYAPTLTGGGASGTWGISITGNAGTASTLQNARTIACGTAVSSTATKFDGGSNITIPITAVSEAYLAWGGKNIAGGFGPIDAAMVDELGANRFAFMPAEGVEIQYSTNGGSTWSTYTNDKSPKINLFNGNSYPFYIGANSSINVDKTNYRLRVIITTDTANVYTTLNKFIILCSTNGSAGSWCTIDGMTQANVSSGRGTWTTFASNVPLSGWSGYNVINTPSITTYGNNSAQYQKLRFTFGVTSHPSSVSYAGLVIYKIMGFGGMGWNVPSTMAANGSMYTYDYNQNVFFPAQVTATTFVGALSGTASKATALASSAGSSTMPVYINSSGQPVTCNSTLSVSITGSSYSCSGNSATASQLYYAPTLTIGNTGKTFRGDSNLSWSLSEIGAPSTTGSGASGTWGISISGSAASCSGNAASASKLYNSQTIWGQSFNGTSPVSGALSGATTITASSDITSGGNIYASGAVTAKVSSSDIRLKTDISAYSAMSIVRKQRSVKYHWNDTAKANAAIFNDNEWHYGLIAQELQKDLPQIVSNAFGDFFVIQYERLIPILWRGVQEIDDDVSKLKRKVKQLENEIIELKKERR